MSGPGSPQMSPRKGKQVLINILMLDDTIQAFQIPQKALGGLLWEDVVIKLQLLEADYFDLEYTDVQGMDCWLDHEKLVLKQIVSPNEVTFRFSVKFYTPDPGLLEEEYTRYLFALQVKRDLMMGLMPSHENTAALLASYIVQAETGDFLEDEYTDHTYLSSFKFVPHQSDELEMKVMDHHRRHIGQSPADADFNLLDTARKVEMYGVRMHLSKDHEGVPLNLAVAHMGVLVFQNCTKINTFSWAKIRKLSFKRKKFLIKLHPESYTRPLEEDYDMWVEGGYYKDTVEFYFDSRNECKNFWKKCIEHHAFFRCHAVKRLPRNKTRVVSRGSSFRYSGKTQKQLVEYVRDNYVKRPPFERTFSTRTVSSRSYGATSKTSTLNSTDLLMGHATYNSTSSGSHVLEMSRDAVMSSTRVEKAEVHDDSSQSGSRSLSPKKDLGPSGDEAENYPEDNDVQGRSEDEEEEEEEEAHARFDMPDKGHVIRPGGSPQQYREHPPHFLSQQNRKMSAPVFSQVHPQTVDERFLSRSPEVENIPEKLEYPEDDRIKFVKNDLDQTENANIADEEESIPAMGSPAKIKKPPPIIVNPPKSERERESNLRRAQSDQQQMLYDEISEPRENRDDIGFAAAAPPEPVPLPVREARVREYLVDSHPTREDRVRDYAASRSTASVGLTSSASVTSSRGTEDSEDETRRKRYPADKAYYIAKELLMTERTYKKDLEVLTVWFRNAMSKDDVMPENLMDLLYSTLDPIYEFHCSFLKEIEQRLAMWEGKSNAHLNGDYQKIGDVMLNNMKVLQLYREYLERQEEILTEIELSTRRNKRFEHAYKEFEAQKVCYLPLNTFLLKPAQRLLHYKLILERLLTHYPPSHPDYQDCDLTLSKIVELVDTFQGRMRYLENLQKLIELQRDLVGIDNLVQPNREFIREGCLQKQSRKGYQQRMFFLFSDMLVYTSRIATPTLQFKVHCQLTLRGMMVDETDPKKAVANSFTIYGGNRCLLVAASSQEEKNKWLEDLTEAIAAAKERGDDKMNQYPSLKSNASSSDNLEETNEFDTPRSPPMADRQNQRANTTMHVCWHRNTSVSMRDHSLAVKNQLSGYLLRKFKSTNGWQKLWVVFTNFCLFFYKTFQDDFPLASLPLLGYSVTTPSETDNIHKDYVFKLQFKNHVYFFRAESEYTFERWVEVINSATQSARRTRLFSRMESMNTEPNGNLRH